VLSLGAVKKRQPNF